MKKPRVSLLFPLMLFISMIACVGPAAAPSTPTAGTAPDLPVTPEVSAGLTPAPPSGPALKPGTYNQKIMSGGAARTYILHVPPGYDGSQALPLVLVLHGFGGNAASMVKLTGFG